MAKIVDPDDLYRATTEANVGSDGNIFINTTGQTITVGQYSGLTSDGVTLQTIYSYLKEEWKDDNALPMFDFPMVSITNEQFELSNGWDFGDTTTKNLIRDGGWSLVSGGTSVEEYMNITTLGSFDDSAVDQAYYLQVAAGTPTDVVLSGEVNQAIQIYSAPGLSNYDYRTYFQIFLREEAKAYDFGDLIVDQNITALTYKKYALPLSNSLDTKITNSDATIAGTAPYTGMSIEWTGISRTIGASSYNFSILIDGNNGTAEEIYEFVQYQLRQTTDIDDGAGTERGDITDELLEFVGDTLKTKLTSDGGVYIDNFLAVDTNRLVFVDDTGTERTFPFVAAGTISFNDNLQGSSDAKYWMFFTNDDAGDDSGRDYGTSQAIIVKDNSTTDITGTIGGSPSIAFDYDYDNNTQRGGASSGTTAPVTLIAIGTDTAQHVKATGTIIRSTANNFSLVSALERNYSNP
jgi:hypothetical protein